MPDLPTLPALQNPNLLRREVAPFGHDQLHRSGLPYIDNPDAVLAHLADGRIRGDRRLLWANGRPQPK